jgi:hypothetical protein
MHGWRNFLGFLLLFSQIEGIFVIILLRNFLRLFLIMAEWINEDFSLGSLVFRLSNGMGKQ